MITNTSNLILRMRGTFSPQYFRSVLRLSHKSNCVYFMSKANGIFRQCGTVCKHTRDKFFLNTHILQNRLLVFTPLFGITRYISESGWDPNSVWSVDPKGIGTRIRIKEVKSDLRKGQKCMHVRNLRAGRSLWWCGGFKILKILRYTGTGIFFVPGELMIIFPCPWMQYI